jgi:hypothetical protein
VNFELDDEDFGPAMLALDERKRKFVLAVIRLQHNGAKNAAAAARAAGYSDHKEACKVQGHLLMHSPRIQAALTEETRRRINLAAAIVATPVVIEIALDKKAAHRDRLHAAEMLFNRGGFAPQTEHKVTVEHQQPKQFLELAERLAKELNMPAERLLGINRAAAVVLEGVAVEIVDGQQTTDP